MFFWGHQWCLQMLLIPGVQLSGKTVIIPLVEKGASIGANSTIVCGNKIGTYSFIGAGAVVTKDVKPYALVVGNPARQTGWMSEYGHKLILIMPDLHPVLKVERDTKLKMAKFLKYFSIFIRLLE
jgi:UDP-2-acetamido-3-amino-2,3-dideoxy-glucuronate N-acetyltransferase